MSTSNIGDLFAGYDGKTPRAWRKPRLLDRLTLPRSRKPRPDSRLRASGIAEYSLQGVQRWQWSAQMCCWHMTHLLPGLWFIIPDAVHRNNSMLDT